MRKAIAISGLLLVFAAVGLATSGTPSVLYVATTGNDTNDGQSWATALADVSTAESKLPSGGGTIYVAPGSYSTAPLTFTLPTIVECLVGATFSSTSSTLAIFTFEGSNSGVTNCTFNGSNQMNTSQGFINVNGSSLTNFKFLRNTFNDMSSSAIAAAGGNSYFLIEGNTVFETGSNTFAAVNVRNGATHVTVSGNHLSVTGVNDGVTVEAEADAAGPTDVAIVGNTIVSGRICVEEGNFSGTSNPQRITVSSNTCLLTGTGALMGMSLTAGEVTVAGNTIDLGGSHAGYGIEAFANSFAVTGNAVNMNTASSAQVICITDDATSATVGTISGNSCYNLTSTATGIYAGQSEAGVNGNLAITGNSVVAGSTSWTGHGIWIQCNDASLTCENYNIAGNVVEGNNGSGSIAIVLEHDSGTMANISLGPDMVAGVTTTVSVGSGISNVQRVGSY